jgi:hypothetical protein
MSIRRFALAAAAAALVLAASAAASSGHQDVAFDPATFSTQKDTLIDALHSKTYYEISDENKTKVIQALNRMQDKLGGITAISELSETDKLAVFNDQELINTLLTQAAEDSRLICKREKKLGSNMPTNVCMTVAQRREAQRQAQEQVRNSVRGARLQGE